MTQTLPAAGSRLGTASFDSLEVVVLEELLVPPVLDWVLTYALAQDARLVDSQVMTRQRPGGLVDKATRRSRVLAEVDRRLAELMRSQIRRVLPDVLVRMDHAAVDPTAVDVQLSVTEHGGGFREHADAAADVRADRQLSYVLFVHREPRGFSGGHLRLYDSLVPGESAEPLEVEPVQNRMVVFPARFVHQVTEVEVPSGRFEDGRFTLNGWVSW